MLVEGKLKTLHTGVLKDGSNPILGFMAYGVNVSLHQPAPGGCVSIPKRSRIWTEAPLQSLAVACFSDTKQL